jgi:hypothetical protein
MAYNPMNPQGSYTPNYTSTYVPPKKKNTTNNSQTLINVQSGYVAPAKTTIPGINNNNVLTTVQSGIKPAKTKTSKKIDPFEKVREKASKMTTEEKINALKTAKDKNSQKTIDEVVDIIKENPTMAGVFAGYQKKAGIKPLVTPIETTPQEVPVIKSQITTPGLEPTSEALIKAQQEFKAKPVSVDIETDINKNPSEKADEITGGEQNITKDDSDKIKEDLNVQEEVALNQATTPEQKNNIMQYFNKLQNEITKRTISQLKAGKEQALIGLGQAQAALAPQYEAQRARAATTSMQQARNLSEYLAARGQSTSGLAAQAELSRGTGLTRQLGEIGQQQQAAQDQLNANKAKIQSDFQLAIANAKSDAEIAKLNEQFRQAVKQEERAYQESITADNRAYAEELLKDDRKYNEMIFRRNRAIELGDREAAKEAEKEMIDYRAQVELNLATQKAALEPQKESEYNYADDPNFADAYNQIANRSITIESWDGNTMRTVQQTDPQKIYEAILGRRIQLVNSFGEEGYKILLQTAKDMIPKETGFNYTLQ